MADGYFSEDLDSRLRSAAPVVCRLCVHLLVKRSVITDLVIVMCERPTEASNSEVLSYLLTQQAKAGSCGLFDGF